MSSFKPREVFMSVNPVVAKRYLYSFLAITGVAGTGKALPNISQVVQNSIKSYYASSANYNFSQELISYALALSLVGLVFMLAIVVNVFNAQIVLTMAKCAFLDSFLFIASGLLLLLPNNLTIVIKATIILCLGLGFFYLFVKGLFTFYYRRKQYGDAILEAIVIIGFSAFLVKPLVMLFDI